MKFLSRRERVKIDGKVCSGSHKYMRPRSCSLVLRDLLWAYLKVTITCGYIFLRFRLKTPFASAKFCDLYAEMVQIQQN